MGREGERERRGEREKVRERVERERGKIRYLFYGTSCVVPLDDNIYLVFNVIIFIMLIYE